VCLNSSSTICTNESENENESESKTGKGGQTKGEPLESESQT
jgi:hypothetical protein